MSFLLFLFMQAAPLITVTNIQSGATFRNDTLRLLVSAPNTQRMELWLIVPPEVNAGADQTITFGQTVQLMGTAAVAPPRLVATKTSAFGVLPSSYVALEWGERPIPLGSHIVKIVACSLTNLCSEKLMTFRRIP